VSEELENSLQQAIESYLGKRLGAIDEQLSRLQSDFDEALKRLRESSANESLTATSLSAAIFAHLQTARSQKLSGAMPERAQSSGEVAIIKRVVEEIEKQQLHSDILGSLLTGAAQFAERAALFVIRNEQLIGWRECEAGDPTNLELIGGVSLPLSADTLLGRAAHSRSTWNGAPGSDSEDSLLIDQLGGDPQTVAAVPLVVRGKVVAVLYADSVSHDPNAVNVDALELLARVAAMAVNLASAPRAVPEQQPAEPEAVTTTAVAEPEVSPTDVQPVPVYTPEIEPQTTEVISSPVVEEVSAEPTAEYVPEEIASPVVEEVSAEPTAEYVPEDIPQSLPEYVPQEKAAPAAEEVFVQPEPEPLARPEEAAEPAPEPIAASPAIESTPPAAPTAPIFTTQYTAPLGSARRYGVSEPDLPIDIGEEERRLHNDARRFARLLVSEIKLYNEPKVKEGRSHGDLYDRLREDIDRSRQMYNKRVAPPVAARHDYFHQELVNTLAEGDPAKLGDGYPGAAVAAN
jgi:GAF domain